VKLTFATPSTRRNNQSTWAFGLLLGEVFHDAAQSIAAHLCEASIGVVDHHSGDGLGRRKNRQDAVGPDASMSITELPSLGRIDVEAGPSSIENDEIVP
jgi:hypothetical protein